MPTPVRTIIPLLAVLCSLASPQGARSQAQLSVIIERVSVVDGTGREAFISDVGIGGDRIVAVGELSAREAAVRIDGRGLVLAPGFIDIHSHAVGGGPEGPLDRRPDAENLIRQGVTTVMGGQDGSGPLDIGVALAHFDAFPAAVNVGLFVGQGSVRAHVMGLVDSEPTEADLASMRALVTKGMSEGAFGLSSGLEYAPGMFAGTEELAALAKETAPYGGLYISHVRDEGAGLMDSVNELIAISGSAGVAGQLTHHKVIGKDRWGATARSLARVEEARSSGLDITVDVYPYTASSTGMTILFPAWSKDGGLSGLQERLADPTLRSRIRAEVIGHIQSERGSDPSSIVAASCGFDASLAGKSLADMAVDQGLEPGVESAADIAMAIVEQGSCQGVFHSMSEDDVIRVMRSPNTMIGSDGGVPTPGVGSPHPRSNGTFARVLHRYVNELSVLTLEEAVHKMSGQPAARLGLHDRGEVRPGAVADLALFRLEDVVDQATFAEPHAFATGMRYVFVGGRTVLHDGEPTGIRAGRPLRKP